MNRSIDRSRTQSLRHRSWSAFPVRATGLASPVAACGEPDPPAGDAATVASSSGLAPASLEEIAAAAAENALAAHWTSPSMLHGEETCSDCDEQIVRDGLATPMARALGLLVPEEPEGLRSVRGVGLRQEFELADGRPRVKVASVIGAGTVDHSRFARLDPTRLDPNGAPR